MTEFSLAPGFIKLHYEAPSSEHVATLPVLPYLGVGDAWFVQHKSSTVGASWTSSLTAYITVLKPYFPTTVAFTFAELWTQASDDADPVFVDTAQLAIPGTSASALVAASQVTFSLRTQGGHNMKLVGLDTALAVNTKTRPPYTGGNLAFVNYVLGGTNFIVGRDGTFPIACPKILTKTNDVLRRKYNLT